MVEDINPGDASGLIPGANYVGSRFTAVAAQVYFEADDGIHGRELWVSDGTEAGTQMVVDALPGADEGRVDYVTAANGNVFFMKLTSLGQQLPWVTGPGGTLPVTDNGVNFTTADGPFVELNGEVYFTEGAVGWPIERPGGLWKASGANATQVQAYDNTNNTFLSADLDTSAIAHDFLYFTALSAEHGQEIWRTNGTTVERVTDLNPGAGSPFVDAMYSTGDTLYFSTGSVVPGSINGVWSINGPDSPAQLLRDFGPSGFAYINSVNPVTFGDYTYFWATSNGEQNSRGELWRTDGTVGGTSLFFDASATPVFLSTHDLAAGPNGVYFFAKDSDAVYRLWSSDGEQILAGPQVALGAAFVGVFDGEVLYVDAAVAGPTDQLTRIVHIGGETLLLPENVFMQPPYFPTDSALAKVGSTLFFAAWSADSGVELWKWEQEAVDPPPPPAVRIDIKPGDDANTLNLASNGMLSVALFSAANFDATRADIATVVFAGASVAHWQHVDIDGDGRLDLLVSFRIQETNLRSLYEELLIADPNHSSHQTASVALTGAIDVDGVDEFFAGYDDMDLFVSGKALRNLLDQLGAAGAF